MTNTIRPYEISEKIGKLLPSQRAFIGAPERYSAIAAGFASGKSYALCTKGLLLSAAFPGNVGMFLRYRGTDVEKLLLPLFMEEVCPPEWINSYHKKTRTVVLRNNSVISFEHLHDAGSGSGAKTRRLGANLGWFGIDQGEECQPEHWDAMISRLRLPRVPKKFGFMALNPGGRDWIYDRFFRRVKPWPRDEAGRALPLDGKFFQRLKTDDETAAFVVNSEENRISNGGFVEDKFFDSLLQQYGKVWVERFVYSQFDDFKGKLFPDYNAGINEDNDASVHNIKSFSIPRTWPCIVGIDVGGDSPWCVQPNYVDERGNLIVTQGFHKRTGRVSEVAAWIKRNIPWNENRTTFVLDPENPVARVDLADHGIYCQNAVKDIMPGLLRMEGYFHIQKHRDLPEWYADTQPPDKILKFRGKGSPMIFVADDQVWRHEHDSAKWHPDKPDQLYKTSTLRLDSVDSQRYICSSRPEAAQKHDDKEERYLEMEKRDPLSARSARAFDRKMQAIQDTIRHRTTSDMYADLVVPERSSGKYDWTE